MQQRGASVVLLGPQEPLAIADRDGPFPTLEDRLGQRTTAARANLQRALPEPVRFEQGGYRRQARAAGPRLSAALEEEAQVAVTRLTERKRRDWPWAGAALFAFAAPSSAQRTSEAS